MTSFDFPGSTDNDPAKRRALLVGGATAEALRRRLADSGYETLAAFSGTATASVRDFTPDVVLIVLERNIDAVADAVAIARRMREEPTTHALPLILVYVDEERVMRSAALNMGVDDCFGIWTPHGQILARLDALFWRIEAGRRAASMAGDKRTEIDNFMVLLEAVREDIRDSSKGALALIYAISSSSAGADSDKQSRDRTLGEAFGFFRLNLRRMDSVGFYGPTTLLTYLPHLNSIEAAATLNKLRSEFLECRAESDLAIGVASFPDECKNLEALIELAEASAVNARAHAVTGRHSIEQVIDEPAQVPQPIASDFEMPTQEEMPIAITSFSNEGDQAKISNEDQLPSFEAEQLEDETDEIPIFAPVGPIVTPPTDQEIARAAAEHAAARERERRKRGSGSTLPQRLLLTVSDAARMAQLNALVRSAGYEARTAFDGQQALDLLRIESPDVVLLDYELRGIDGLEMLRRLRKQTNGKLNVPVVMLLAPMKVMVRREALELGARGIVTMPYDPAELLDSVRLAGSTE